MNVSVGCRHIGEYSYYLNHSYVEIGVKMSTMCIVTLAVRKSVITVSMNYLLRHFALSAYSREWVTF